VDILEPAHLPSLLSEAKTKPFFEIEIGCGNGHFISEYAKAHPEVFLLGIELKNKRCLSSNKKIEKDMLANVRIMRARAEAVLAVVPETSVDRYHVYFPDPWPKQKHRRRRFLRMPNLDRIVATLKAGGEVHFMSDVLDYALQAKILFSLHPALHVSEASPPDQVTQSVYATKFKRLDYRLHSVSATKR
jgi:tRNA (guanine-N7-)-methyltransferase